MNQKDIGGWFCYNSINGRIYRCKYSVDGDGVHRDTRDYYEAQRLVKYPLTVNEYENASLDELEAKYPRPKETVHV
jgi:hypothetical protein